MRSLAGVVGEAQGRKLDVICAGEAFLERSGHVGGAVSAARALVRQDVRTGLATVLPDNADGVALRDRLATEAIDVAGVALAASRPELAFTRGGARQRVGSQDVHPPIEAPEVGATPVLLLSGLSPVVAHAAALCKLARAASRAGARVVVDLNAQWDQWAQRDARALRMIVREADVVWCSFDDLRALGTDEKALRASLTDRAVLALSDAAGTVGARGSFGEVTLAVESSGRAVRTGERGSREGDSVAAAICFELARIASTVAMDRELWLRALKRGRAFLLS